MALNKLEIIKQIELITRKTPETQIIAKEQKQNLYKILLQHKNIYCDESAIRLIIDIYDFYAKNKNQGDLILDLENFLIKLLNIRVPYINSFHNEITYYVEIHEQINLKIERLKKDIGEIDPSKEIPLYTFKMH